MTNWRPNHTPDWVHRLDPRSKLLLTSLVLVVVFHVSAFGVVVLMVFSLLAQMYVGRRAKPLIPTGIVLLAAMTILTHGFWGQAPYMYPTSWYRLSIPGLTRGCLFALRLVVMAGMVQTLAQSTSPMALSTALHWLIWPLRKLKVPVPDLPMLLAIGTRFLPELQSDARRLVALRRLRYGHVGVGHRYCRDLAKGMAQVGRELLVPLLRHALRRASQVGDALALRGYSPHHPPGIPPYVTSKLDYAMWATALAFMAAAILVTRLVG